MAVQPPGVPRQQISSQPAFEGSTAYHRFLDANGAIDYTGLMQYSIQQVEMDGQTRAMLIETFSILAPGWENDLRGLEDLLSKDFGLPDAVRTKVLMLFKRYCFLLKQKSDQAARQIRGIQTFNEDKMTGAAFDSGFFPRQPDTGNPGGNPSAGVASMLMPQQPQQPAGPNMKQLAIQALLMQNGGRMTQEIFSQIEQIMKTPDNPGVVTQTVPGSAPSQTQQLMDLLALMQMMQQMGGAKKSGEPSPEIEEIKNQMQSLQQMMMTLASRPQVPVTPPETKEDKVFSLLVEMVKDKGKSPEKGPFDEIAMEMVRSAVTERMGGNQVIQAIEDLGRRVTETKQPSGMFSLDGVPLHPEAIKSLVDLQRVYGDIESKKAEFQNNQENRQMIKDVISTVATQIGQAVATTLIQNSGTPQEQVLNTTESKVDDGSVVQTICPNCQNPVFHPAGAPEITCMNCGSKFHRTIELPPASPDQISQLPAAGPAGATPPTPAVQQVPPQPQSKPEMAPEHHAPPGQVVVYCPSCQVPMSVPPSAVLIACPICKAEFQRTPQGNVIIKPSPIMKQPDTAQTVPQEPEQQPGEPAVSQEVPPDQEKTTTPAPQEVPLPEQAEKNPVPKAAPGPITSSVFTQQPQSAPPKTDIPGKGESNQSEEGKEPHK